MQILEVCYKTGVKVVTIYAFSIENFKRSKFEVDALMDIAKVKLSQLAQHGDLLDRYGASVRVLGRRELLKPDVVAAVDRAVELTSRNGDHILNVCFPYTSRDEMATAVRDTVVDYSIPIRTSRSDTSPLRNPFSESHISSNIRAQTLHSKLLDRSIDSDSVSVTSPAIDDETGSHSPSGVESPSSFSSSTTLHVSGPHDEGSVKGSPMMRPADAPKGDPVFLSPETITSQTLTHHMFTKDNPPLDLLFRTSGVERLSDFMLWQCHQDTEIVFSDVLWPEFGLWYFLPIMWRWQRRMSKMRRAMKDEEGYTSESQNMAEKVNTSTLRRASQVKGMYQ